MARSNAATPTKTPFRPIAMTVTVRYSGQARTAAARAHKKLHPPATATLDDLLTKISQRYGNPMSTIIPTLLIFIGDEQVDRALPRPLNQGDDITLLSPISGG